MRPFNATELAYLANKTGHVTRTLVWVEARNRNTNAVETSGFWDGLTNRDFVIGAATRTYYATGSLVDIPPIVYRKGFDVRVQRMSLSPLSPVIAQMLRGYDTRGCPVEIRQAFYSTDTNELVSAPRVVWKGIIDEAPIPTPEIGGTSMAEISMVSGNQDLSKVGYAKKSDEKQKRRSGDRILRYAALSGEIAIKWGTGEEKVSKPGLPPVLLRRGTTSSDH